jgi:hypothetical protein
LFNQAVNHIFAEKDSSGIFHLPRISIDLQLILQRRSWWIPLELIPLKANHESLFGYYTRLRQWQQSASIPNLVYYSVIPDKSEGRDIPRDQFKPQYLDFSAPILVDQFHRQIRTGSRVKLEEMLPLPEQLEQQGDSVFCKEWVVEWSPDCHSQIR